MVELYGLAPIVRIFFSTLLTISIILQTMHLFLLASHKEHKIPGTVLSYEILILAHFVLADMMLMITLIQRNIIAGYFYEFRFIDVALIVLGVWIMLRYKKPEPFICALFLFPMLPLFTHAFTRYIFLFSNLYLVFRSALMLDLEWRRIRGSITKLSIKDAVDLFPGGILYASEKGRKMIANPGMNRLLSVLGMHPVTNALSLWEDLRKMQNSGNISVRALDEKLLVRTGNAGSWLFSNETIVVSRKKYRQLFAIDITDEDVLTRKIEESNNALNTLGCELALSLKNIERLEKEREILRMKTRVHDILGQRLSILSRLLEGDMNVKDIIKNLKPLLADLTQEIMETTDTSPQNLLSSLANSFALIGTDINLKGALPEAQKVAGVFAEIIRECATNAVRHADASNVYVDIRENDKEHTLLVCNDGVSPSGPIIEGGGIAGIRGKVRELTGVLRIVHRPRFHIHICIPKNRKDDTQEAAPFIFHPADRSVQVRSWP